MFYRFNNLKKKIPFPFIDIYFFKWNELKPTGIHNHAKNGCYVFLLKGKIKEDIYNNSLQRINTNVYHSPSISYMNDKIGYHCIQPLKKSISIHIYHPKDHQTKYFINNK
mgnify:CR=1 FL=1|tara:strand:+ start:1760 stop:2089 length:330 start_codon:yes stop_codon:yes gene_type:complete